MPDNFLHCMSETEDDFESDDPARRRAAMRRLGVLLMRMRLEQQEMIERHKAGGEPMNIAAAYTKLERIDKAVFGEDNGLEQNQKGLVGLYRELEAQRRLLCYVMYGVIGLIGLTGVPEIWAVVKHVIGSLTSPLT